MHQNFKDVLLSLSVLSHTPSGFMQQQLLGLGGSLAILGEIRVAVAVCSGAICSLPV